MAASSDGYLFYRKVDGSDRTTQTTFVATGATGVTLLTVRNATTNIYLQRIRVYPTTFATGALIFTETDATGAIIGEIDQPAAAVTQAAKGEQDLFLDFGPLGWKLAAGKNLFMTRSATGSAAGIVIEAYERTSGPVAIGTSN